MADLVRENRDELVGALALDQRVEKHEALERPKPVKNALPFVERRELSMV